MYYQSISNIFEEFNNFVEPCINYSLDMNGGLISKISQCSQLVNVVLIEIKQTYLRSEYYSVYIVY